MDEDGDPWGLRRALAGDVDAWTALVDEFGDSIWRWARAQGLSREDAEDASQMVWYILKDKGHTVRDPRRLPGWLATTTRHVAQSIAARRWNRDRVASTAELSALDREPDPTATVDVVISRDQQERLIEAFNTLRERCRELLALLWNGQLSYADISAILGMPIGSIGPTRERCLGQLRARAALQ